MYDVSMCVQHIFGFMNFIQYECGAVHVSVNLYSLELLLDVHSAEPQHTIPDSNVSPQKVDSGSFGFAH